MGWEVKNGGHRTVAVRVVGGHRTVGPDKSATFDHDIPEEARERLEALGCTLKEIKVKAAEPKAEEPAANAEPKKEEATPAATEDKAKTATKAATKTAD